MLRSSIFHLFSSIFIYVHDIQKKAVFNSFPFEFNYSPIIFSDPGSVLRGPIWLNCMAASDPVLPFSFIVSVTPRKLHGNPRKLSPSWDTGDANGLKLSQWSVQMCPAKTARGLSGRARKRTRTMTLGLAVRPIFQGALILRGHNWETNWETPSISVIKL